MFELEPTTFTVAELAVRWQCTHRQIFERAKLHLLPLYFPFDGFAYDVIEERRRVYDGWKESGEIDAITRSMEANRERLRRHAAGEVSEWEDGLTELDVMALRLEQAAHASRIEILGALARARQAERDRSRYLGDLIATPETVALCEQNGFAPFPEIAYHPEGKFTLSKATDGEYGVLDGRMLRLGERRGTRDKLSADDLRVMMADVKAIETGSVSQQNETEAAPSREPMAAPADEPEVLPKGVKGITKTQVLTAFGELVKPFNLANALKNGQGLFGEKGARTQKGTRGGKHAALWSPVILAVGLRDKELASMPHLKRAFSDHPFLREWSNDWGDALHLLGE